MKFEHVSNSASAIPRKSRFGILIFGHAFFIGKSDRIGTEITIASRRFNNGCGMKIQWFKVKKWG